MDKKRLAIITTHPIQYNAPLFDLLSRRERVCLKVFYTWSQARSVVKDSGFGHEIKWDIPLLSGYDYEFVANVSKNPGNRSFFGIQTEDLIERIEAFAPNAILVFGWNFKSHLDTLRYFKGKIPVWFRGDSHLLDEVPGLRTISRRLFLRWVYRYIDKAFYVGSQNKAYHVKHGLREEQLIYAPHAIDNERFKDSSERCYEVQAKEKRIELGLMPGDLVILFAGKFEPKKNPMLLIKAFNTTLSGCEGLKLLMVGSGILEEEIKNSANGNPNIKFLSFQNQSIMPVIYRVGDVFCLPSVGPRENWGLAVNEALACGRPVIVSDKVGCSSDLIIDHRIGWKFKCADDTQEIATIISNLDLHEIRQNSLRQERQDFIRNWSYAPFCDAIENLI